MNTANDFLAAVQSDDAFRSKLVLAKNAEERRSLAAKAGFRFSQKELQSALGELSDYEKDLLTGAGLRKRIRPNEKQNGLHSLYCICAHDCECKA
jgi:predicted ribosomally synthesized peptide with nif11-like leader